MDLIEVNILNSDRQPENRVPAQCHTVPHSVGSLAKQI